MRKLVLNISNYADKLAQGVSAFILGVLLAVIILQVVARYVFDSPPVWTEELARYAMIWTGLLGATMSFKQRFDPALFAGEFWEKNAALRILKEVVQSLTVVIFLGPILWFSIWGAKMNLKRGFLARHTNISADTLEITTIFVAIAVPIAIVLIMIHLMARWAGDDTRYDPE
jgi:TRAP-type C4-dicarboxylate transport system permease small subunit